LVCESIDALPERTPRAAPAHRIVDAFLMRTPHDAVGRDRLLDAVLTEKVSNAGGNRRIVAYIDRLRRPRAHREGVALAGALAHRDDEFRRERVVWPIWRDGCQGVLSIAPTAPSSDVGHCPSPQMIAPDRGGQPIALNGTREWHALT